MNNAQHEWLWFPFEHFGITTSYTAINVTTVINTWIALGLILAAALIGRYFIMRTVPLEVTGPAHIPHVTILSYGSYLVKSVIKSFVTLVEQSAGTFIYRYYTFTASIFLYILFCNWVGLIPFAEEPTQDLNTTLALGIIALIYIQKEIMHVHGFAQYLKDYFLPVAIFFPLNIIIGLAMFPLKVLGELASVISLSFRLFGNIFGGAIIMKILKDVVSGSLLKQTLVTILGLNLILTAFFVLFEGALQAFVFAILTLTNITMATSIEEGKH